MPVTSATLPCRRLHAVLVVQLALVASCTDPIAPDPPGGLTACDASGGTVQRSSASATWRRAGSPHRLEGDVTISGSLTIEAGALVCASPGAGLTVMDSLTAIGTHSDSIRFLPADVSAGWKGLELGQCCFGTGWSQLRYVRLAGGPIRIGQGVRMDSVLVEGGGVHVLPYSAGSFDNVVVRRSPGVGIQAGRRSYLWLSAVRIEESAGIGLSLTADLGGSTTLTIDRPIRITDGASHPVSGPVSMLDELLGESGAADSLTGNARDTLLLLSIGQHTLPMTITPALAWRITRAECVCSTLGPLHMQAGSTLRLALYEPSLSIRELTVDGNTGARASIIGGPPIGGYPAHFVALTGETATLRGTHLENVRLSAAEGSRVTLEDVTGSSSSVDLSRASAAALSNVRLHSGQEPGLVLGPGATAQGIVVTASAGHGLTVRGAGVQLTSCTIGGNMGHGVLAESGDIRIRECSLLPNGVDAVAAQPGAVIDARDNWWGDPSGPGAANTGTVSGTVTYEPVLVTPPAAETDAATIEIVGGSVVATSDTIRLDAIVRDAQGNIVPFEPVVWSALDPSTAEVFPGGLVFGAGVGQTTITAAVNGSAAVRTSVTVQVVPGAPVFDWEQWEFDETVADVWAHDGQVFVVGHGGRIFRFDGSTWSTEQITSADVYVREIWGRSASDVYVLATDRMVPNVPRSGLFHYDGSAWTDMFVTDGLPGGLSGTADGHLFLASQAGLMHYDGSSWAQILDEPVHSVWARAADDVFYVAGYASTITVWRFDGTTSYDVRPPVPVGLRGAADVLLGIGAGLWQYNGPGDWRKADGSENIGFHDAAGVDGSDVFTISGHTALRHYDGSTLRPVWVRGATVANAFREHRVAVDGPYVYVVADRSLLRGTRR